MAITKLTNSGIATGGVLKYDSMLAGNPAYEPPGEFQSISTITVGAGGASSVEFTSIPQTYTHLQIRGVARSTKTTEGRAGLSVQVNSDTGSNYAKHNVISDGATVTTESQINKTEMFNINFMLPDASATANVFGGIILDFADYANTNKNKTVKNINGFDNNGTSPLPGRVGLESSLWMNTSAITSIKLFPDANNWAQHTSFSLYGIVGTL